MRFTALPKLVALRELHGCIVTIDALGCQRALAERIVEQGGEYVLGLKGNQGALHEAVEEYFTTTQAADFRNVPYSSTEKVGNEQGRWESRRYWITEGLGTLPRMELWKGVRESRPGGTGVLGGRNPEHRTTLLHQLHRRGRQAVGPCGAGALERGKPSALAARWGVSRR